MYDPLAFSEGNTVVSVLFAVSEVNTNTPTVIVCVVSNIANVRAEVDTGSIEIGKVLTPEANFGDSSLVCDFSEGVPGGDLIGSGGEFCVVFGEEFGECHFFLRKIITFKGET